MKKRTIYLTQGAMIAAIYVVLTVFAGAFNLASGAVQVRISEALTILPIFTPAAIPGLFVGCLIANLVTGSAIWDIVFGSLTTLLAAYLTYHLKNTRFLHMLPPVILNAVVVPVILVIENVIPGSAYLFSIITVGAGEAISVIVFGFILERALTPIKNKIGFIN